jgi:protein required for attachment to host cells
MNKPVYLLVADGGHARIFNTDSEMDVLDLVLDQASPFGRKTRFENGSDRPGRTSDSTGHLHGPGNECPAKRYDSEQFAKYLCLVLNKDNQERKFTELMIAAPPHFLGALRRCLNGECRKVLSATIDKDLLRAINGDIRAHFEARKATLRVSRVAS